MLYDQTEKEIKTTLNIQFTNELELLKELFISYERLLSRISGSEESLGKHKWLVMLLLGQNLTLLNNSFDLWQTGYIPTSIAINRLIAERLTYAIYFAEFPTEIDIFNNYPKGKRNYWQSVRDQLKAKYKKEGDWIENLLLRVDLEGAKYKGKKTDGLLGKDLWNDLIKEANYFVHMDEDYLYGSLLSRKEIDSDKSNLIMGPQVSVMPYRDEVVVLIKIFKLAIWNTLVLMGEFEMILTSSEASAHKTFLKNAINTMYKLRDSIT